MAWLAVYCEEWDDLVADEQDERNLRLEETIRATALSVPLGEGER